MTQTDAIQVMKADPDRWWYTTEVYDALGRTNRKPVIRWKQLVKYGFIESKEADKTAPGIYYQYRLFKKDRKKEDMTDDQKKKSILLDLHIPY